MVLRVVLLLAVLLACCVAVASADEGNIGSNNASLYYIKWPGQVIVIFFPGELNSQSSSSENAANQTFRTDVSLQLKGAAPISVQGNSTQPNRIEIDGKEFLLSAGTLFRMSPEGKISQLPFAPLEPTRAYLTMLADYFRR